MNKIYYLIILTMLIACGGTGIEGYVNEPITITANNPEDGMDLDYFWSLMNQPDGSLINSGDLISSDEGQEMIFIPDYPGDYSIEVIISQYGDEISNQTFSFTILEKSNNEDIDNIENQKEDWLDEEIDYDDDIVYDDEISDDSISVEEDKYVQNVYNSGTNPDSTINSKIQKSKDTDQLPLNNNKPIVIIKQSDIQSKVSVPKIDPKSSIAAKSDRFTIQLISKRMFKDAQLFSQKLISKGYDSYIQRAMLDKDEIWYRVRIGSYDNYNSAKKAADNLSDELKMPTWVDFVRKEQ